MRRAALVCTALSVLLLADGIAMQVIRYHPGDQNAFFGNPRLILSDGQVVLISAGFLTLATVVMWLLAARRPAAPGRDQSADAPGPGGKPRA